MKLSWSGKLMAAAIGARLAAAGLRSVADCLPVEEEPVRYYRPDPPPRRKGQGNDGRWWHGAKCPKCFVATPYSGNYEFSELNCQCGNVFCVWGGRPFSVRTLDSSVNANCLQCGVLCSYAKTGYYSCHSCQFPHVCYRDFEDRVFVAKY